MLPLSRGSVNLSSASPAWLQRKRNDQWVRLQPHDEERLTAAAEEAAADPVPVCGGRAEALLSQEAQDAPGNLSGLASGQLVERYIENAKPVALQESVWCFKPRGGSWTPFHAADDSVLELQLQELLLQDAAAADGADAPAAAPAADGPNSGIVTNDGLYTARLVREGSGDGLRVFVEMKTREASGPLGPLGGRAQCSVSRGWAGETPPPLSAEEIEAERTPPSALVLVVHGIGEALWRQSDNKWGLKDIHESVAGLRALAAKAGAAAAAAPTSAEEPAPPPTRVEFLAVDWDNSIRGRDVQPGETAADRRLRAVSLKSVPSLREFANEVLCDVLFYEQPAHRRSIQERVASRVRAIVSRWHALNPTFGGQLMLLGHSLGSLICFDLLSAQPAPQPAPQPTPQPAAAVGEESEPVEHAASSFTSASAPASALVFGCTFSSLVMLGSPLGCFLAIRGQPLGRSFALPTCGRLYNIFARNDPVAYRVEPLLLERDGDHLRDGSGECQAAELPPPEYLPFAGAKHGKRMHIMVRQTVETLGLTAQSHVSGVTAGVSSTVANVTSTVQEVATSVMGVQAEVARKYAAAESSVQGRLKEGSEVVSSVASSVDQKWAAVKGWAAPWLNPPTVRGLTEEERGELEEERTRLEAEALAQARGEGGGGADKAAAELSAGDGAAAESTAGGDSAAEAEEARAEPSGVEVEVAAEELKGPAPGAVPPEGDVAYRINGGERVDYQLQETLVEDANEYFAALTAHNTYFAKRDIAAFLVSLVKEE